MIDIRLREFIIDTCIDDLIFLRNNLKRVEKESTHEKSMLEGVLFKLNTIYQPMINDKRQVDILVGYKNYKDKEFIE